MNLTAIWTCVLQIIIFCSKNFRFSLNFLNHFWKNLEFFFENSNKSSDIRTNRIFGNKKCSRINRIRINRVSNKSRDYCIGYLSKAEKKEWMRKFYVRKSNKMDLKSVDSFLSVKNTLLYCHCTELGQGGNSGSYTRLVFVVPTSQSKGNIYESEKWPS